MYATLQLSIDTLPVNKAEFEALLKQVKQQFLTHGQQALEVISDIFVQWQDIRRQLMMWMAIFLVVALTILKISRI